MLRNVKVLFIALAIFVIAGSAYAFAAANTVPASSAGYKDSTVSGYTVSLIEYDLVTADPTKVDFIKFTITDDAATNPALLVLISTDDGTNWSAAADCTITPTSAGAATVSCDVTDRPLVGIVSLDVVASSTTDPTP